MIAVRGRRWTALLLAPVLLLSIMAASSSRPAPTPTAPLSVPYSPPPREPSPFSKSDQFCDAEANEFPTVKRTDSSLKRQPISVVLLAPSSDAAQSDIADDAKVFASLISMCGGIGGRPFDLHVVAESGDPMVDCFTATVRFRALLVISATPSAAQSCIVDKQHTIMITEADVSNADLRTSRGRLFATGSSEGVMQARMLDLVTSGRLDGHAVAIVAGDSTGDRAFGTTMRAMLAKAKIRVVDLQRANAVLMPNLDPALVPSIASANPARRDQPLDLYTFSQAEPGTIDLLLATQGGDLRKLLRSVNVHAFSPVVDPGYRMLRPPNAFSEMCNEELVKAVAKATSASTTTLPTDPPLDASYLRVADVCLLVRTAARGLFYAGAGLDQTSLMVALHRLPYLDLAAPGGTPKPRPNQLVNEPVKRIAQVVVVSSLQSPCPISMVPGIGTSNAPNSACWQPASGWDDGGRVVNVPLTANMTAAVR